MSQTIIVVVVIVAALALFYGWLPMRLALDTGFKAWKHIRHHLADAERVPDLMDDHGWRLFRLPRVELYVLITDGSGVYVGPNRKHIINTSGGTLKGCSLAPYHARLVRRTLLGDDAVGWLDRAPVR